MGKETQHQLGESASGLGVGVDGGHDYVHGPTSPIKLFKCMQQSPRLVNRDLAGSKAPALVACPSSASRLCVTLMVTPPSQPR